MRRALPPVGWQSTAEQEPQSTTVWLWENTVVMLKQPCWWWREGTGGGRSASGFVTRRSRRSRCIRAARPSLAAVAGARFRLRDTSSRKKMFLGF